MLHWDTSTALQIAHRGWQREDVCTPDTLHFYGNMAFALNLAFVDAVDRVAAEHLRQTGQPIRYRIPLPGDPIAAFDRSLTDNSNQLPEVIASIGFENLFASSFRRRFIESGRLQALPPAPQHPAFEAAGLVDPERQFTVHAVTPYVFLVDRKRLGSRELPRSWMDILHPRFRNSIVSNGSRESFSYILLLYIYQMAGMDALRQLAENMHDALHAALIARVAGRAASTAAVYILPWFFACACPWTEDTVIVWPDDGAIVSPMWLVRQPSICPGAASLINLIASAEFARSAASLYSPSSHPAAGNWLPEGATLRWLGWEFLRNRDPIALKAELLRVFHEAWRAARRT